MKTLVNAIRWFNYACPWNQHKHSLGRWAEKMLDAKEGHEVYHGIQGDLSMRLDLSSYFERWIYLNTYEIVTLQLIGKILNDGDVFVDLGANLGLMTLTGSRAVGAEGKVYSFEPQPPILPILKENIALSHADNVELIEKGCWHEAGTASLSSFSEENSNVSSMHQIDGKVIGESFTIETVRVDEVVKCPVKAIKLDVEGAELSALKGAIGLFRKGSMPHVIIELNALTSRAFGYEMKDLVDWLLETNPDYRLHLIKGRRTKEVSYQGLLDVLAADPDKLYNVWFESRD